MFSGIGGFELGISRAFANRNDNLDHLDCVGFSEVNKYAVEIYLKHFPDHKNYGDATRIVPEDLPDFDFLCGGFPCQAFSIAGKRGGFQDTRGTLFFEIARILSVKRPKLLLLENVAGLLSHDKGRTFGTILSTLSNMGYFCEWQILNSKDFGVPQNRERVFIIGHLGKSSGRKIFPIGKDSQADIELPTLTARYWGGQANGGYLREITKDKHQGQRVYNPDGISQTILSGGGGLGAKTGLYMIDDTSRKKGIVDKNIAPTLRTENHGNMPAVIVHNLQPRCGDPRKGGVGPLSREDGNTYCLDTGNTQAVETKSKIRRLTPIEAERLQGFPDGWTEFGVIYNSKEYIKECAKKGNIPTEMVIDKISDSQRYKCLGNAVTVNVIQAIMERII